MSAASGPNRIAGSPRRASRPNRVLSIVLGGLGLPPAVPKPSHIGDTPLAFACWQIQSRHANSKMCLQEPALSDVDQPALGRQGHGLGAADGVELFQNSLHVILHRVLTDVEDLPDFLIALPEGHLLQNLKFALG